MVKRIRNESEENADIVLRNEANQKEERNKELVSCAKPKLKELCQGLIDNKEKLIKFNMIYFKKLEDIVNVTTRLNKEGAKSVDICKDLCESMERLDFLSDLSGVINAAKSTSKLLVKNKKLPPKSDERLSKAMKKLEKHVE